MQLGSCRSFLRLEVVNRGTLSFETCVPDVKHKSRKCVPKWLWYQRLRAVLWGEAAFRGSAGSIDRSMALRLGLAFRPRHGQAATSRPAEEMRRVKPSPKGPAQARPAPAFRWCDTPHQSRCQARF